MITKEILQTYVKKGLLTVRFHPTLDLCVYNYTQKVQYEQLWDDVTLMCRCLVTDFYGNIVARGFNKFFNWEEPLFNKPKDLSNSRILEKLDGSFIMLFWFNDQWVVASKGSFDSAQVELANQILGDGDIIQQLNETDEYKKVSHCFELLHPMNRIVVDYKDDERLVYLGSMDTKGVEHKLYFKDTVKEYLVDFNYDFIKNHHQMQNNFEGYVIKFGDVWCKIKSDEYKRLHAIVTECSSKKILQSLINGNNEFEEILNYIPDEFYHWVKWVRIKLTATFVAIKGGAYTRYMANGLHSILDDSLFAKNVDSKVSKEYKAFMYMIRKGMDKNIDDLIWRRIKNNHIIEYPNEQ